MKSPSDDLFHLIKSLSKAEKKKFKQYVNVSQGEKRYLDLFNLIDKQDRYEEKKLIDKVGDEFYGGQFSVAKNYLYRQILKCLAQNYSGPDSDLNFLQVQINILMEKGLFRQSRKLVTKAQREAGAGERFHELHRLLGIELRILKDSQDFKSFEKRYREIQFDQRLCLEKLENLQAYQELKNEAYRIVQVRHNARKSKDLSDFSKIMSSPLMEGPENALSVRARLEYLQILLKKHHYEGDIEEPIALSKQVIGILEEHRLLKEEDLAGYVNELSNLVAFNYRAGNYDGGEAALEKLKGFRSTSVQLNALVFEKYYNLTLAYMITQGQPERGIRLIKGLESELKGMKGKIRKSQELWLYYLVSTVYFLAEDYNNALYWVNRFLNEPRTEVRIDLQCFVRLLNLMIHLELGNNDLVEAEANNTSRFIYKRGRMYSFERLVLKTVRKLSQDNDPDTNIQICQEALEQLDVIREDNFEKLAILTLDVPLWLRSKIEGKPMVALKQSSVKIPVGSI